MTSGILATSVATVISMDTSKSHVTHGHNVLANYLPASGEILEYIPLLFLVPHLLNHTCQQPVSTVSPSPSSSLARTPNIYSLSSPIFSILFVSACSHALYHFGNSSSQYVQVAGRSIFSMRLCILWGSATYSSKFWSPILRSSIRVVRSTLRRM